LKTSTKCWSKAVQRMEKGFWPHAWNISNDVYWSYMNPWNLYILSLYFLFQSVWIEKTYETDLLLDNGVSVGDPLYKR